MARNNKITRKKAYKAVESTGNFVSGVNSKDSKQKPRRWTFQAHVTLAARPELDAEGKPIEGKMLPESKRILKLDRLMIGTTRDAAEANSELEAQLKTLPHIKEGQIRIEALAQETISSEILKTINGYQDMVEIYHLALSLASEDVIKANKPVIVEGGIATETLSQPEIDAKVKEFYMTAANTLRASRDAAQEQARRADLEAQQAANQVTAEEHVPGSIIAKMQAEGALHVSPAGGA